MLNFLRVVCAGLFVARRIFGFFTNFSHYLQLLFLFTFSIECVML